MDRAAELAMAERHVCQGEATVTNQVRIVAELQRAGHPTKNAERLLASFELCLDNFWNHLRTVQRED